jgi:hypothetical protein
VTDRPVVLLHSQPASATDWELVIPHRSDLRLLVPTRPGYGTADQSASGATPQRCSG